MLTEVRTLTLIVDADDSAGRSSTGRESSYEPSRGASGMGRRRACDRPYGPDVLAFVSEHVDSPDVHSRG
jgi:hypothetical protein